MVGRMLLRLALSVAALLSSAAPAAAAVEISFYSRELGTNFPHAFVVLRGTLDATGERIDTSFGFTATTVTPAILFGAVRGEVAIEGEGMIRHSTRQFALTLTDEQYRAVMAVADRWRALPQPSFHRHRSNCVLFVAAIAETLGLRVDREQRLISRPRSFLQRVRSLNPQLAASAPPGEAEAPDGTPATAP